MNVYFLLSFSPSVVSDFLWPLGLRHTRLACPSPSPQVCSYSCPLVSYDTQPSHFCHPLLLLSIFSSIRVISNKPALCIRWPKHCSFCFSISTSNEYSGLAEYSKASALQHSVFIVQLLHLYMTTRKTIALARQTFVGKVMCLLFNMLSRFVIVFLPRSKIF